MLDAGDVEEVILVIVGEVPLHLCWIHAGVGLRDVDRRDAERRKDVTWHRAYRQERSHHQADDEDYHRQRPSHCYLNEVHRRIAASPSGTLKGSSRHVPDVVLDPVDFTHEGERRCSDHRLVDVRWQNPFADDVGVARVNPET